jgi:hypothetical protein
MRDALPDAVFFERPFDAMAVLAALGDQMAHDSTSA